MKEFEQRLNNHLRLFRKVRKTRQFISLTLISFIVQNRIITQFIKLTKRERDRLKKQSLI